VYFSNNTRDDIRPFEVLALDLDGTIKRKGEAVEENVIAELQRLRSRGVGLVLDTGRCWKEVAEILPVTLFDAVVFENGALLEAGGVRSVLTTDSWMQRRKLLVKEFGEGCEEVIVSLPREMDRMVRPFAEKVGGNVDYNRDRVMILPPGVDKGKGLEAALARLGWKGRSTASIGDGENDAAMLRATQLRIAVRNAVDSLKQLANLVTEEEDGEGFVTAMRRLIP
jgi:hydroxymethylpyrimidine pyrophosphatase-like HAD family hydrolase